jgi:hypothetical protein
LWRSSTPNPPSRRIVDKPYNKMSRKTWCPILHEVQFSSRSPRRDSGQHKNIEHISSPLASASCVCFTPFLQTARTFSRINTLTIPKPSYSSHLPAYEDETVFRNVGI